MGDSLGRALDLVGAHCDLEKRLGDIPPSARARGIWLRGFEQALDAKGKLGPYTDIFGARASALTWYPCGEVIARIAVGGALYASPADVHAGMRALGHVQPIQFAESLLGKTLLRVLSPDPVKLLQQGAAARRQACNYGSWEFDLSEPRRAIVTHRDEYGWLESQVLGSAEGTFESVGIQARIEQRLTDPYNGVTDITW